jgi:hypothetical protein
VRSEGTGLAFYFCSSSIFGDLSDDATGACDPLKRAGIVVVDPDVIVDRLDQGLSQQELDPAEKAEKTPDDDVAAGTRRSLFLPERSKRRTM